MDLRRRPVSVDSLPAVNILMEDRGDFVDTIVPRAMAAGGMPVAETLGAALGVPSIQVVVAWSAPVTALSGDSRLADAAACVTGPRDASRVTVTLGVSGKDENKS